MLDIILRKILILSDIAKQEKYYRAWRIFVSIYIKLRKLLFFRIIAYRRIRQDLGQGLKDALKTRMMMMLIFLKRCYVSFGQTLFFKFTIKTLDRWRHKKRLWRHHFDLSNFWFEAKKITLIHNLSHQYRIRHFSKKKEMTSPTIMSSISKQICLYLLLKINSNSKFGSSTTFGLAVGQ